MDDSAGATITHDTPLSAPSPYWNSWQTLLWGVAIALFTFAGSTVVAIIYQFVIAGGTTAPVSGEGAFLSYILITSHILACVFSVIAAAIKYKTPLQTYFALYIPRLKSVFKWLGFYFSFYAAAVIIALIVYAVLSLTGNADNFNNINTVKDDHKDIMAAILNASWLSIILAVISGPISEEVFFRGFLLPGFANGFMGPKFAVVFVSLLFTLTHTQYSIFGMIPIFFLGLLLGFARLRSGTLLIPIMLHMTQNSVALIIASFADGTQ